MNTATLRKHHAEGEHPCVVHASTDNTLNVCCTTCRGPMVGTLFSDCEGVDRRILMFRCPVDAATGQLRFTRPAVAAIGPAPGPVAILDGQAGYQRARCPCGSEGSFGVAGVVAGDDLRLDCVLDGCGHSFALAVPTSWSFRVQGHRHG